MRNLVLFIWKYSFFFFFIILEIVCFYLIIQNNRYQQASVVNSANSFVAGVSGVSSNIREYFYLKEENDRLARENATLWNHSLVSFNRLQSKELSVHDTIFRQKYTYLNSKVVNNSINRRNNIITLNRGRVDSVATDMAVMCSQGVVGVVKDVSANYCTVISMLHGSISISAKLKGNGYIGPLEWNGEDPQYATLTDIPVHVPLKKGQAVVTSAYSLSFPENILVGHVDSYEQKLGNFSYSVKVKLSTDFQKLSHVYIVKNLERTEQEELEALSTQEN